MIALALVALIGRMVGLTFPREWESAKASELVQYNLFLRDHVAHRAGERSILVVHPGYDAEEFGYYVAPTLFYVQVLRREGRTVEIQAPLAPISSEFTSLVACGETARELHQRLPSLSTTLSYRTCRLFRRGAVDEDPGGVSGSM